MADEKVINIRVDDGSGNFEAITSNDESIVTPDLQKKLQKSADNLQAVDEALLNFVSATEDWEPVEQKKPGRPKGTGKNQQEKQQDEAQGGFLKFLRDAEKVAYAMTGVNSKLTKTFALLIRSTKLYQQHQQQQTQTQQQQTQSQQQNIQTQQQQTKQQKQQTQLQQKQNIVLQNNMKALGNFGKLAGQFALVATAAAILGKKLNQLVDHLEENVGKFSPALNIAKATTDIRLIQEKMRSANRVGGELASLETSSGDVKVQLQRLETNLIDLLSPFIRGVLWFTNRIIEEVNRALRILDFLMEAAGKIIDIQLKILETVPLIGWAIKRMREKWAQDDLKDIEAATRLNRQVESVFDPAGVGLPGNAVDERFL